MTNLTRHRQWTDPSWPKWPMTDPWLIIIIIIIIIIIAYRQHT